MPKTLNLGRKRESSGLEVQDKPKKNEIVYPTLYIHDLEGDVGIEKSKLEKDLEVTAKIRITDSVVRTDKDKTTTALDIEVRSIEFEGESETSPLQDALSDGLSKVNK